ADKSGLQLIPVTSAFRAAELAPILQFTKPEAVITLNEYRGFNHHELFQSLRGPELKHILIEDHLQEIFTRDVGEPPKERRHTIRDVCQIATTSGSTGIPKCVEVPLYTRLMTGSTHVKRFQITPDDTLAAVTPIVTGTADAL